MINILTRIFKLDFLGGMKTRVIGWAMVVHAGSSLLMELLNAQPLSETSVMELGNGLALLGLRSAIEKG